MPDSPEVNLHKLAALLVKKRGNRPLREVAEEIGEVSAPTLSRIEKGNVPDIDTFMRLCRWLNVSPEQFQTTVSKTSTESKVSTAEGVCALLRADKTLPVETVKALTTMIELAYRDIQSGKFDDE